MKNIALLGFGNIGKNYYKNSLQKNFLIKKILRKKKMNSNLAGVTFFENFRNLVKKNNIDGYILATPVSSHYEYARKIIKRKKPFIIEKPIVKNTHELENLYEICKNYKHSIFVNHTDLYNPAFFQFLKRIKLVGKFKQIDMTFGKLQKIKLNNNSLDENSNLPSFEWLPHPIAIIIKLGGLPKKIFIKKNSITIENNNIFQKSIIHIFCKKMSIKLNFSNKYKNPKKKILINGTRNSLMYDGYRRAVFFKKNKEKYFKKVFYSKKRPLDNLLDKFYFSLKHKQPRNDMRLAYKTMKILFQIENEMKSKLNLNIRG